MTNPRQGQLNQLYPALANLLNVIQDGEGAQLGATVSGNQLAGIGGQLGSVSLWNGSWQVDVPVSGADSQVTAKLKDLIASGQIKFYDKDGNRIKVTAQPPVAHPAEDFATGTN